MASAWLAAALAFVYPGLGHLYLRAWFRAVAWFGLALSTVAWLVFTGLVPRSALDTAGSGGVEAFLAVSRQLPAEAQIAVFMVTLFNAVDAYITGRQTSGEAGGESCPECGRELDEEIDFCPWCTARLEESTSR